MTPLRRTTLQFSQSFFTDARTFIFEKEVNFTEIGRLVKRRHAISR